jgi:hypothetical protein
MIATDGSSKSRVNHSFTIQNLKSKIQNGISLLIPDFDFGRMILVGAIYAINNTAEPSILPLRNASKA